MDTLNHPPLSLTAHISALYLPAFSLVHHCLLPRSHSQFTSQSDPVEEQVKLCHTFCSQLFSDSPVHLKVGSP